MSTNRIMVFGGGMIIGIDGTLSLHKYSLERAIRAIEYYDYNKELFNEHTDAGHPFIICTGGYGLLSNNVKKEDATQREAALIADYLIKEGGIPKKAILLEQESTSTLTNWTKSLHLYKDLLDVDLFSSKNRLGLVSHPYHLKRVVYLAKKLGYREDQLELIPTTEQDNQDYESHVLDVYKDYLKDCNNPYDMEKAEKELAGDETLMAHLKSYR
jgi:uncharacterized SAM-binding protein YcdF (DUF218 family)